MNPSDMASEYANIKNYCRTESAKTFKHPLAPKAEEPAAAPAEPEPETNELSDDELEALLNSEG